MTSQISTRKLLKMEIRQSGWMLALTTLGHFLLGPVLFLLYTSNYNNWTPENAIYRFNNFYNGYYFSWQLFGMIVSITMCIYIYRYLFSKRMVDLYHSVPINRSQLFIVKYLHGFLIWFLPFILNTALVALLTIFRLIGNPEMGSVLWTMLKSIALIVFCFFIFYHLFLTAVHLSGNVLNMFVNVAIIGLSVIGLYYLFYSYANTFFNTFCYTPPVSLEDIIYAISPFAAPFGIYIQFSEGSLFTEHVLLLVLNLIISIALLVLAWRLCLKRPSELAERGTLAKKYTIPARIMITLIAGIAGSLFFSEITSNAELAWGIFGALLCSILCFGAMNSIFSATIKTFFKYKPQMILATVLATAVILVFQLDLLGYDTYVPRQENIAGMAIKVYNLGDNTENYIMDENGYITHENNEYTNVAQEELITDQKLCYDLLNTFVYLDGEGTSNGYVAKVKLKNGYTYERYYHLASTHYTAVAPFVENDTFKNTYYKYRSGVFGYPDELEISLWGQISSKVNEDNIDRLMDAYWQDFEEHYTLDELSSNLNVATLRGRYYFDEAKGDYTSFSANVPNNYTRTLEILTEILPGYMTAADSPDNIQKIHLYAPDLYDQDINMRALYEYFGYETEEVGASENGQEEVLEQHSDGPSVVEIEDSRQTYPVAAISMEVDITDPEKMKELYPLLYFGSYRDVFYKQEYISLGYIITENNLTIDCYVKPGTFPEEWIEKLYETREEVDY